MVLIASLCLLAPPQLAPLRLKPMPEYRPAFVPAALAGARCEGVDIRPNYHRGFRPIVSRWVLKKPFAPVAMALRRETQVEVVAKDYTEEMLGRSGMLTTYRTLPDRMIEVQIQRGRFVKLKEFGYRGELRSDDDAYVTATLTERPLNIGPKPRTWLPAAAKAPALPASFPGIPISGLSRTPDVWSQAETPGGAQQYWMTWFVAEPPATAYPRFIRELGRSGDWKIGPQHPNRDIHCEPKASRSRYVWLSLEQHIIVPPDIPPNVSRVSVSWVDTQRRTTP